jgi:uncharacterized OsmC-like protein
MLNYKIQAISTPTGKATAQANKTTLVFDTSSGRDDILPNPAELLLTALAACILKNVQRFSEILKFNYSSAQIEVAGTRNDSPPFISEITYKLQIDSEMDDKKLHLLHKNILKFGTITNTLAKASNLQGTISFLEKES